MRRLVRLAHAARWVPVLLALSTVTPPAAEAYRPFVSTDASVAAGGDVEVEFGAVGFRRDGSRRRQQRARRRRLEGRRARTDSRPVL